MRATPTLPHSLQAATRLFTDAIAGVLALTSTEVHGARRRDVERAVGTIVEVASEIERLETPEAARAAQRAFRAELQAILAESWIMDRSIRKPRGYAGDHLLLDAFYTHRASDGRVGRLLDELVLGCAAGRAVVDRKRYVAGWLTGRLARLPTAVVADIACGPCRLEKDLLDAGLGARARFVAMDGDDQALAYAREVLGEGAAVELWHENAIRIARDPRTAAPLAGADLVVSLGLFDYLPDRIATGLLRAFARAMRPGGELLIGNFAADNPSRVFMEWFGDWPLIHRTEEGFLALFEQAGFGTEALSVEREAPGGSVLLVTARVGAERRVLRGSPRAAAAA